MAADDSRSHGRTAQRRPLGLLAAILLASLLLASCALRSFTSLNDRLGLTQQCRMSRMMPAYIDHTESLENFSPSGLWRKYRLYLYRERSVEPTDIPSGSPAIFVPGNAGSYAQVRSVASSAANQYYKPGSGGLRSEDWKSAVVPNAHTDWWTVDFNEDFSAFSGSTVIQQATFLNEVVAYLRSRYPSPGTKSLQPGERNTSIPILAHSMGGISARLMTTLDNYNLASIDTVVTLSTPHAMPPVPFDRSMESVYKAINQPLPPYASPLLVSISGGLLDTQLPSGLSSLSLAGTHDDKPSSRVSTFSSSLSSLWSSVDHLAIMWCDQLREKIARGFLLDVATFGYLWDERNTGSPNSQDSVLRRRRELWRRLLELDPSLDAGNSERGAPELLPANAAKEWTEMEEISVKDEESPLLHMDLTGSNSILLTNASTFVYNVPARTDDEPEYEFEVITNLCVGANPTVGTGPAIPQNIEVIVLMCSHAQDPTHPTRLSKAACELALPWRWQLIPPSELPESLDQAYPPQFPDAHTPYHMPSQAYRRLHIDARMVHEKRIEFIRIETRSPEGLYNSQQKKRSFVRASWTKQGAGIISRNGSALELRPSPPAKILSIPIANFLNDWVLPMELSSSLLAYDLELLPTKCFLKEAAWAINTRPNHPFSALNAWVPAFAPMLRASNPATGDSRWYTNLIPNSFIETLRSGNKAKEAPNDGYTIRLPLSLHGPSPFFPAPPASQSQVHIQLWTDPAMLSHQVGSERHCVQAFELMRIRTNWRTSVGLLLMHYRFFIAAWPLALLALTAAKIWHDWLAPGSAPTEQFPSLMEYLVSSWCIKRMLPIALASCVIGDLLQRLYHSMLTGPDGHSTMLSHVGLFVGMPQPLRLAGLLIGGIGILSYTFLVLIVLVLHHSIGVSAAILRRLGLANRLSWGLQATYKAASGPRFKPSSLAGIVGLLVAILLFVPYQFVFLVVLLLQVFNTLRSRLSLTTHSAVSNGEAATRYKDDDGEGYSIPDAPRASGAHTLSRYNQHLTMLVLLLLFLPQKGVTLVVWARNLAAVGLVTPHTSASWVDHNVFDVAPVLLLGWVYAGGRELERPRTRLEARAVVAGLALMGVYGLAWGIRYTYGMYDIFNATAAVLVFAHWRARTWGSAPASYEPVSAPRVVFDADNGTEDIPMQPRNAGGDQIPIHYLAMPVSAMMPSPALPETSAGNLDALLVEYLDLLDAYQAARESTSASLSSAFLQLSRARMEIGHKRLGPDSYDARLLPELRASQGSVERVKPDYSHLIGEEIDAADAPASQQLRRRGEKTADPANKEEKKEKKAKPSIPDALAQFAALPTPNLRASQRDFRIALDGVLGVSGRQGLLQITARLRELEERIRRERQLVS